MLLAGAVGSCTSGSREVSRETLPTTVTVAEVETSTTVDVSNVFVFQCAPDARVPPGDLEFLIGRPVDEAIEFAEANDLNPLVHLPDEPVAMEQVFDRLFINATPDGQTVALACNN